MTGVWRWHGPWYFYRSGGFWYRVWSIGGRVGETYLILSDWEG